MNPQIFGLGNQGKSLNITAQRRVNVLYYLDQTGDRTNVGIMGRPALRKFKFLGRSAIRGRVVMGQFVYVVAGPSLVSIRADGTVALLGALLTNSGRVYAIQNGTQVLVTDGINGYVYTAATGVFLTNPANFPGAASCAFANNYGVVNKPETGQFYLTGLGDFTAYNPLDFSTADSLPDNLVRVFECNGLVALLGEDSTEFWSFSGAADFPFGRVAGSAEEWGLGARSSVAVLDDAIVCLARSKAGEVMACKVTLRGFQEISDSDLARVWNGFGSTVDAMGSAFSVDGHPLYLLNFPSANRSWVYDSHSGAWGEWTSYRNKAFGMFRGLEAFGWNGGVYFTDAFDGTLWKLDKTAYADDAATAGDGAAPIEHELISRKLFNGVKRLKLPHIEFGMDVGGGTQTGQGTNPQLMLQISRNGGKSFGTELWRSMGKAGEARKRIRFGRLGSALEWIVKIRHTDPTKFVLTDEALTEAA